MDNYKKSLIKAQAGYMVKFKKNEPTIGPLTETQATVAKMKEFMNDPMSDGRGPRITTPKEDWRKTFTFKFLRKNITLFNVQ